MNAKTEKKKEILIRSFETLKDGCRNSKDTRDKVEECVGSMFKMDVDMATEMWIYLLEQYSDMLSSNEGWGLIGWIYWIAGDNIGEAAINNIVLKNAPIKRAIFELQNGALGRSAGCIIRSEIEKGNILLADELINLLFDNQYKEETWYEVMDLAIPWSAPISDEAVEMLESWFEKVEDKEERAKLDIRLAEIL